MSGVAPELREYQSRAVDAARGFLRAGKRSVMLVAPMLTIEYAVGSPAPGSVLRFCSSVISSSTTTEPEVSSRIRSIF